MPDDYGINPEIFFRDYGAALVHGYAAVFAGAGLSRAAGFVDWKELLREFADELGLDLEIEQDLVTVAQYHLNAEQQNRGRLHQKLVAAFSTTAQLSESHLTLAKLPIRNYWTSNYDDLIESALRAEGKKPAVKRSTSSLTATVTGADANVYKLHGDLADPQTIIITRDDYANYVNKYPGFSEMLRADLIDKTLLFLGFSFTDPHLDYVLTELKRDLGKNVRPHFAIMQRETRGNRTSSQFKYAANRQRLQVQDLERYGIKTVLVNDYAEIPQLLQQLRLRYLRRQVFVSGAAVDYLPRGPEWISQFAYELGMSIIDEGYNLVSGFGWGIGSPVISGSLEALYREANPQIDHRLLLRPFPQTVRNREEIYGKYRTSMLATAGFAVLICGNRTAKRGGIELSPGMQEEYEIARELKVYPLPVGSTGSQAAVLWEKVESEFKEVFPSKTPRRPWRVLNSPSTTTKEVVEALFILIRYLSEQS